MTKYWFHDEKYAKFIEDMSVIPTTSEEYHKLADELNAYMVDQCGFAYMSTINWYWYVPADFEIVDEGLMRTFYNCYWNHPEEHQD